MPAQVWGPAQLGQDSQRDVPGHYRLEHLTKFWVIKEFWTHQNKDIDGISESTKISKQEKLLSYKINTLYNSVNINTQYNVKTKYLFN